MGISLPRVFDIIREMEEKYDVDGIKAGDSRLWNLIRVIMYFLAQQSQHKPRIWSILREAVLPLNIPESNIWAFSGAESRKFRKGTYYDIYMDPLYDLFRDLCVFEWPTPEGYRNKGKIYSKKYVKMHVPIYSTTFYSLILRKNISIDGRNTLNKIIEEYSSKTGFSREAVKEKVSQAIIYFDSLKKFFIKILKKHRPNAILIRCGYGRFHMALAEASRHLDIPSIELQHGIITRYHAGYVKATESDNRDGVPEYLLTYGDEFTSIVRKGSLFEREKVVSVGFPYMDEVRGEAPLIDEKLKKFVDRFSKIIFITSQWIVGDEIKEFALKLRKKIADNVGIVLKPHPRDWRSYEDIKNYDGIFIADKFDDIYEIFKVIHVHSTAYSTSGLEALAFARPNIFIKVGKTSIEDIIHVVDNSSSFIASSPDEYAEIFDQIMENYENASNNAKKTAEKFFKSNAKENIRRFMEKLDIG